MDAETLEALKGSIAKWEAIVAGTGVDNGTENCPLCQRFHYEFRRIPGSSCEGCPVADAGHHICDDTPYVAYCVANKKGLADEAAEAALAEVEFLKSLLPPEAP